MRYKTNSMNNTKITRVLGFSVLGMGGLFTLSSHLHLNGCLQPFPCAWPISMPTSICIFLSGAALVCFNIYSKFFGMTILALALHRFVELFTGTFQWIDLSQMKLITSFGFSVTGILFILNNHKLKKNTNNLFSVFLCTILIAISSFELCLTFDPIEKTKPELHQYYMHFYTALAFFFIGIATLHSALKINKSKNSWKQFIIQSYDLES